MELDGRRRTKAFSLEIIKFSRSLGRSVVSRIIARQLIRSGTSVGANFRAAMLAKSDADMIAKLKTVEEELDESAFWMELLVESGEVREESVTSLLDEQNQLFRIVVSSIKTLRQRNR
jgi:four helix bundle protein